MNIPNNWILEYSFSQRNFIAIKKYQQMIWNRKCLMENIPHDYVEIQQFETKAELEEEVEYIKRKMELHDAKLIYFDKQNFN